MRRSKKFQVLLLAVSVVLFASAADFADEDKFFAKINELHKKKKDAEVLRELSTASNKQRGDWRYAYFEAISLYILDHLAAGDRAADCCVRWMKLDKVESIKDHITELKLRQSECLKRLSINKNPKPAEGPFEEWSPVVISRGSSKGRTIDELMQANRDLRSDLGRFRKMLLDLRKSQLDGKADRLRIREELGAIDLRSSDSKMRIDEVDLQLTNKMREIERGIRLKSPRKK